LNVHIVNFSPESREQLVGLYRYLAAKADTIIAFNYVNAVVDHCEKLKTFPLRGVARDDIRDQSLTRYKLPYGPCLGTQRIP